MFVYVAQNICRFVCSKIAGCMADINFLNFCIIKRYLFFITITIQLHIVLKVILLDVMFLKLH